MKANITMKGLEALNTMRKPDKYSVALIYWLHTQILKQQKQLNGRNHHIHINIITECQWTQLPHQKTPFGKLD
jgi:hypothetical protein